MGLQDFQQGKKAFFLVFFLDFHLQTAVNCIFIHYKFIKKEHEVHLTSGTQTQQSLGVDAGLP